MFVYLESFFILKYKYHTNKILCFNSFEYFIGIFIYFIFVIYSNFLAFFESVERNLFDYIKY
jgi:hypothetical protein